MLCKSCGEELNADAVFCSKCGTPVDNNSTAADNENKLFVARMPYKVSYRPGQEILYDGLIVKLGDEDVTSSVSLDPKSGSRWAAEAKHQPVTVTLKRNGQEYSTAFILSRKNRMGWFIGGLVGVALLAAGGATAGYLVWRLSLPDPDMGTHFVDTSNMSDEDAQAMLDEQTENSRIKISIAPQPELDKDKRLRVNFVVASGNNGFSERLEIVQDGENVYSSAVIEPEHYIEWGQAHGNVHAGPAVATVYAVGDDGNNYGNPISVEIEIVEA